MSSKPASGGGRSPFDDSIAPIHLVARRYDDCDVQQLVNALYSEQLDTCGFADSPGSEAVSDYVEPHGLFLVVYTTSGRPVGCGGYRTYDGGARVAEVRKMYALPECRGRQVGWRVLRQLERQAGAQGARKILLETGSLNRAAIRLYSAAGNQGVPSYVPGRSEINRAFAKSLHADVGGGRVTRDTAARGPRR